jgi:hypothetical protein
MVKMVIYENDTARSVKETILVVTVQALYCEANKILVTKCLMCVFEM